ncbi:hypothetical protein AwDysgo_02410 [Bacteroidales bacterium]|nr:hypothetical protein AwDysgo_02410 [Bacteroidales bacterium]
MIRVDFKSQQLTLQNKKTYLFATLFVIGNILLPQLCHLVPKGGLIFLPIYFFTLIAAYKFGPTIGLLTAFFSVSVNHVLFGMPPLAVLPILLVKSGILAIIAGWVGKRNSLSILSLIAIVLGYQVLGGFAEWAMIDLGSAIQDFTLGWPGMLFQVVGAFIILRLMAKYEC